MKSIKNFLWYGLNYLFKYLLPIITLPIFTSFLSVEDFGKYALSVMYGTFGSGIINLGLLTVFERNFFELSPPNRKNLLFTTLVFTQLNFSLILSLTFIFSDFISGSVFKQNQLSEILPLALAFQTFKTFNQYFFVYFKNNENAKKYTYVSILESLFSIGLALAFVAFASMGIYGFILGQFLGVFIVFIFVFITIFYPYKNKFKFHLLRNQLAISLPLTPRIFFGVINTQFDRYMLGLLGAIGSVGLYDIGQKIAYTTFSFMSTIQNVYSPQVYKHFFSKRHDIKMSLGSYLTPFFYLSILACLSVGAFSYELLYLFTKVEFHSAAPVISILCILYGFYFFGKQPQLLYAKKTGLISIMTLLSILLNICFNIPLINHFGLLGAACGTTIAGILTTGISFYYGQKYVPINYEKIVFVILCYFTLSIFLIIYLTIINYNYKLLLIVKILTLMIYLYIGWISGLMNYKRFKELKSRII